MVNSVVDELELVQRFENVLSSNVSDREKNNEVEGMQKGFDSNRIAYSGRFKQVSNRDQNQIQIEQILAATARYNDHENCFQQATRVCQDIILQYGGEPNETQSQTEREILYSAKQTGMNLSFQTALNTLKEVNENLDPSQIFSKQNLAFKEEKELQFKLDIKPVSKLTSPLLISQQLSEVQLQSDYATEIENEISQKLRIQNRFQQNESVSKQGKKEMKLNHVISLDKLKGQKIDDFVQPKTPVEDMLKYSMKVDAKPPIPMHQDITSRKKTKTEIKYRKNDFSIIHADNKTKPAQIMQPQIRFQNLTKYPQAYKSHAKENQNVGQNNFIRLVSTNAKEKINTYLSSAQTTFATAKTQQPQNITKENRPIFESKRQRTELSTNNLYQRYLPSKPEENYQINSFVAQKIGKKEVDLQNQTHKLMCTSFQDLYKHNWLHKNTQLQTPKNLNQSTQQNFEDYQQRLSYNDYTFGKTGQLIPNFKKHNNAQSLYKPRQQFENSVPFSDRVVNQSFLSSASSVGRACQVLLS